MLKNHLISFPSESAPACLRVLSSLCVQGGIPLPFPLGRRAPLPSFRPLPKKPKEEEEDLGGRGGCSVEDQDHKSEDGGRRRRGCQQRKKKKKGSKAEKTREDSSDYRRRHHHVQRRKRKCRKTVKEETEAAEAASRGCGHACGSASPAAGARRRRGTAVPVHGADNFKIPVSEKSSHGLLVVVLPVFLGRLDSGRRPRLPLPR